MNRDPSVLLDRKDRLMTHESGHALMCHLLGVSYCGVAYDNDKPGFCTLGDVEHTPLTKNDRLVLAAGAAAQSVVPLINEYEADWLDGVESDKRRFPDQKSFFEAVEEAIKILVDHKATIEGLCIKLCKKIKEYEGRVERLPTCTINGNTFFVLLSSEQLASIVQKKA
jgi:hypothetical protein